MICDRCSIVCQFAGEPGDCKGVNVCDTKQTNADRIRKMTDEELAKQIGDNIDCAICKNEVFKTDLCPGSIMIDGKSCHDIWLEWLKQEAK